MLQWEINSSYHSIQSPLHLWIPPNYVTHSFGSHNGFKHHDIALSHWPLTAKLLHLVQTGQDWEWFPYAQDSPSLYQQTTCQGHCTQHCTNLWCSITSDITFYQLQRIQNFKNYRVFKKKLAQSLSCNYNYLWTICPRVVTFALIYTAESAVNR